jgi:hypothetical protein
LSFDWLGTKEPSSKWHNTLFLEVQRKRPPRDPENPTVLFHGTVYKNAIDACPWFFTAPTPPNPSRQRDYKKEKKKKKR